MLRQNRILSNLECNCVHFGGGFIDPEGKTADFFLSIGKFRFGHKNEKSDPDQHKNFRSKVNSTIYPAVVPSFNSCYILHYTEHMH
jgi:hypothetical protein